MPKVGRTSGPDPQQSQLGYLFPAKAVTASAPYGNDDTQTFRVKLVAGKPELIPEDNKFTPRQAPPTPVKEKRKLRGRQFNEHNITTYPESLYMKSPQKAHDENFDDFSKVEGRQSRQIMSPYKVVPPIKQPINPPESVNQGIKSKFKRACNGETLPPVPIKYSREEERELKKMVQEQLQQLTLPLCKQLYMDLLKLDGYKQPPTGYVSFSDLNIVLLRNELMVDQTILGMVAAQFVEPHGRYTAVNYERVLEFIRASLMEVENISRSQENFETYPQNHMYYNPITGKSEGEGNGLHGKRYGAADVAKLKEKTEKQLQFAEDTSMLPFEDVLRRFREADREHRLKLSKEQIMNLVFDQCRIPLDRQTCEQILDRVCKCDHGQYDWQQFTNFIESVYPASVKTGLEIPKSKRPTEYAKHMPEPSSSWPHGKMSQHHDQYDDYYNSSRRGPDYTNPYDSYDYSRSPQGYQPNNYDFHRRTPSHNRPSPDQKKVTDYTKNYVDPYDRSQSKQSQIESINDALKRREELYFEERNKLLTERERLNSEEPLDDKKWFSNFFDLIGTLYRTDRDNSGSLSYGLTERIIRDYNRSHSLGLSNEDITRALKVSMEESGEYVLIDNVANKLKVSMLNQRQPNKTRLF